MQLVVLQNLGRVPQVFLNNFGFDVGDRFTYTYDFIEKVVKAKKTTTVGQLRPLIEHYEDVRFSRVLVNKQLKESFHS